MLSTTTFFPVATPLNRGWFRNSTDRNPKQNGQLTHSNLRPSRFGFFLSLFKMHIFFFYEQSCDFNHIVRWYVKNSWIPHNFRRNQSHTQIYIHRPASSTITALLWRLPTKKVFNLSKSPFLLQWCREWKVNTLLSMIHHILILLLKLNDV